MAHSKEELLLATLTLCLGLWVVDCDHPQGQPPAEASPSPAVAPSAAPTENHPTPTQSQQPGIAASRVVVTQPIEEPSRPESNGHSHNPASSEGLDARIAQDEALIHTLTEEANSEQEALSNRLRIQDLQKRQQEALFSLQISEISGRIKAQEQVLEARHVQIQQTIVVENSDLMTSLRSSLNEAQSQLNALKDQYAAVVSSHAAAIQETFARESQQISASQSHQNALRATVESLRAEITQLNSEKARAASGQTE